MKINLLIVIFLVAGVHETLGCTCMRGCIDKFNLLTATGTIGNAGTNHWKTLEVTVNGEASLVEICGPGRECLAGAVDYYTLDIERFKFSTRCVRKQDFEGAKLKLKSTDGWYVASVYLFADTCETHELLTANPVFNKWIDEASVDTYEQKLNKI